MKLKDLEIRVNYLNKLTKNRVEKHLPYKINWFHNEKTK